MGPPFAGCWNSSVSTSVLLGTAGAHGLRHAPAWSSRGIQQRHLPLLLAREGAIGGPILQSHGNARCNVARRRFSGRPIWRPWVMRPDTVSLLRRSEPTRPATFNVVLARRGTDRAASTDHTRSHCERSSDRESNGWPLGSTSIGLGRIMHQPKASEDDAGKPMISSEAPARRSGSHSPPVGATAFQRAGSQLPRDRQRLWANKGEIQ